MRDRFEVHVSINGDAVDWLSWTNNIVLQEASGNIRSTVV